MNVDADPIVSPLPPHITFKDAKTVLTMLGSEPELGSVLKNSTKEILNGALPQELARRPGRGMIAIRVDRRTSNRCEH